MNYLGHLYLSFPDPNLMVGNLINDMLAYSERSMIKSSYHSGIEQHKLIDRYTDKHPDVSSMTEILRPSQGKYAPVTLDVVLDFMICHNWYRFEIRDFEDFCKDCYINILLGCQDLPPQLQTKLYRMVEADWLVKQASIEGLNYTLQRMDERASFPSRFSDATGVLVEQFSRFNLHFNAFWSDIRKVFIIPQS